MKKSDSHPFTALMLHDITQKIDDSSFVFYWSSLSLLEVRRFCYSIGYFVKWIQWNSFLSFFRGWSSFLFASCRCLSAGKGPHIFERRGGFQIGQFVVSAICSFWRRTLLSLSVFPRPFFAAFLDVSCTSTRHCLSSIRLGAWFMDRGFLELAKGVQTSVDSP